MALNMADYERMINASQAYYSHEFFANEHARKAKIFAGVRRQVIKDVVARFKPGRTFRTSDVLAVLDALAPQVKPPIWPDNQWPRTEGTVQKYLVEMVGYKTIEGKQQKLLFEEKLGDGSIMSRYRKGWLFRIPPK